MNTFRSQQFAMISLSFELNNLVEYLKDISFEIIGNPPLLLNYLEEDCFVHFDFEKHVEWFQSSKDSFMNFEYIEYGDTEDSNYQHNFNYLNKSGMSVLLPVNENTETGVPKSYNLDEIHQAVQLITNQGKTISSFIAYLLGCVSELLNDIFQSIHNPSIEVLFKREKESFCKTTYWNKAIKTFNSERKMESVDDVSSVRNFLSSYKKKISSNFKNSGLYNLWYEAYDSSNDNFNILKFYKDVFALYWTGLTIEELYAFLLFYCLSEKIDEAYRSLDNKEKYTGSVNYNQNLYNYGNINIYKNGEKNERTEQEFETPEEQLENLVFNSNLFTKNSHLQYLKNEIARSIDFGKYSAVFDKEPIREKINLEAKNEWFFIYAALDDAGCFSSKVTDSAFINQIISWFPFSFSWKDAEEMNRDKRNIAQSISAERKKWKLDGKVTRIIDFAAKRKRLKRNLSDEKIDRIIRIAYKGLYQALIKMRSDIEDDNRLS
jgi:hypothetical protein